MSAFASRDLDFGYVGEAPATVAAANKVADIKIVAQANLEGSAVGAHKDSGLKSPKDLVGKTVAVPGYATVQDFLFRRALTANNIALNSVNTILIKPPEMIPALMSKQIDAFAAWEPYPAKAVTSKTAGVLAFSSEMWPKHPLRPNLPFFPALREENQSADCRRASNSCREGVRGLDLIVACREVSSTKAGICSALMPTSLSLAGIPRLTPKK